MGKRPSWEKRPPTLDEYRLLDLTRPLTDRPLGWPTANRRSTSARLSRLVVPSRRTTTIPRPRVWVAS